MIARTTTTLFHIASLLAVLSVAPAALAQSGEPTQAETRRITACLAEARRRESPREDCIGKVIDRCMEQPGGHSTAGMRACAERELTIWDDRLNRHYQRLSKALDGKAARKLRDTQRLWIKWRDAKCEMPYVLFEGGTMAGPMSSDCRMRTTGRRAIELGYALEAIGQTP